MRRHCFPIIRHSVAAVLTAFFLLFTSIETATVSQSQAASNEIESPGAVFTVTTTADSGDGSLRKAITDANAAAGADTINFQIGTGFVSIALFSPLTVTDPVTIDGSTQPGYAGLPLIDIDASASGGGGLTITSGGSVIRGLGITNASNGAGLTLETGGGNLITGCFFGLRSNDEAIAAGNVWGILITNSSNNQIGLDGTTSSIRNVIGNNGANGIEINGADSTGNVIVGSYIGLRSNGTDLAPNTQAGVLIDGSPNNRIGGVTAAERNVISGNSVTTNNSMGILINGTSASGNAIQGNRIGTDATGTTAVGNQDGIRILDAPNNIVGAATGTTLGGACTGGCNLISGNNRDGIRIVGMTAIGNRVDYNYIGLDVTGTARIGAGGNINLFGTQQNIIGKPLGTPRNEKQQSAQNAPDTLHCIQDNTTGDYLRFNTENGDFVWKHCRTGTTRAGRGEVEAYSDGSFGLYASGIMASVFQAGDGYASIALTGSGIVEFTPISDSNTGNSTCDCPTEGEQVIAGSITSINTNNANEIRGNSIGTRADRLGCLAPALYAIDLRGDGNILEDNYVCTSGQPAVAIRNGVGNEISGNDVLAELPLTFPPPYDPHTYDLNADGRSPNDCTPPQPDQDGGANNTQNFPVDLNYRPDGTGGVKVSGTICSTPNTRFRIDIYDIYQGHAESNPFSNLVRKVDRRDNPQYVTTDENGNGTFSLTYNALRIQGADVEITVTVDNPPFTRAILPDFVSVNGDTSEMSLPLAIPQTKFDFDNDAKADIAVYRPGATTDTPSFWHVLNSNDSTVRSVQFGNGEDRPVAGDFQGDNKADFAIWRPSTATFYNSRISGDPAASFSGVQWGLPTDIPLAGDFDDDGANDAAVFRPSDRVWYIRRSIDGSLIAQQWGLATDKLVPADYDGDGSTDIAVYRDGTWYISYCPQCPLRAEVFGLTTDVPVPGDYDGDGMDDIAVWRPATGIWYLNRSTDGFAAVQWGISTDKVLNGDFDGDGKNDIAVWRPSDGTWYILQSSDGGFSATHWGQNGDIPVQLFPNQ